MKKINVTFICAETEEYPGCTDLLYSYPEVNVVSLSTSLSGAAAGKVLRLAHEILIQGVGHRFSNALLAAFNFTLQKQVGKVKP